MATEKLKWVTVEYPITDFAPIGKVITQRDILEKYKADNPGQEIKALTGFKCDQQDKTVSLRIGVADSTIAAENLERDELGISQYDELADKLKQAESQIEEFKKGLASDPCLCGACANNIKLQRESDTVIKLYEDVRKENDELKRNFDVITKTLDFATKYNKNSEGLFAELKTKYDTLKVENDRLILRLAELSEDSADLVEAKKTIAEGGGISLDEVEDAVENQKPVTDTEDDENE